MALLALTKHAPEAPDCNSVRKLLHHNITVPDIRAVGALLAGQAKMAALARELDNLREDDSMSFGEPVSGKASEALDRISGKRGPWVPPALVQEALV